MNYEKFLKYLNCFVAVVRASTDNSLLKTRMFNITSITQKQTEKQRYPFKNIFTNYLRVSYIAVWEDL